MERSLKEIIRSDLINIHHVPVDTNLADQISRDFDVKEVIVLRIGKNAPTHFRYSLLGEAARIFFKKSVVAGMKVGISGGLGVGHMIYSLKRGECQSLEFYPLATCPVVEAPSIDANSLVGAIAYRHDGNDVRAYTLQMRVRYN